MKKAAHTVELLAPAKDLTCAIEAINHGADAVYIGAPKYGARTAAGNTVTDIENLCQYAHRYHARIYIAFNTLLKNQELSDAERLMLELYHAGVDALIIQDMGITQLDLPPLPLHASTQTDNRTVEKVRFLESVGFAQVVLARELSLNEIHQISNATEIRLEAFVHGALCVSYSGQCFLSAALSGRSANRGECAQYCRLPYTMTDADKRVIAKDKHLLSLKDLNRSEQLEAMIDAGISSFKIEGRLKDLSYVKNITAYYRRKLDLILTNRPELSRSSDGNSDINFEPVPEKSFNRGFTSYFLKGRKPDITSFDTPKSQGEFIGEVKEIEDNYFTIAGTQSLHNGDGLTFLNAKNSGEGFRINKVEGKCIYPFEMPTLYPKAKLFRNYDHLFEQLLSKPTAVRKINTTIEFYDNPFGFTLCMTDESGARVMLTKAFEKEVAKHIQEENIRVQLSKLGNTIFKAEQVLVHLSENWFVPSSLLSEMKREAVEKLLSNRIIRFTRHYIKRPLMLESPPYPNTQLTYLDNVLNDKAEAFYLAKGVKKVEKAFEASPLPDVPLMFTKHCLRYSMGWCPSLQQRQSPYKEPYFLKYKDIRLPLKFDCKNCQMLVFAEQKLSDKQ